MVECAICLGKIKDCIKTPCDHYFCRSCLITWIESNNAACYRCAICRTYLEFDFYKYIKFLLPFQRQRRGARRTRFRIAVTEAQSYEHKWKLGLIKEEDEIYDIAQKIYNKKILFSSGNFRKKFNTRMGYFALMYGDRFLELIKK